MSWIVSKKFDVVFLSELKFHKAALLNRVINFLELNDLFQYELFINSSKKSRGTAVLISKKLNYKVNEIFKDDDENLIALKLILNDKPLTLASVYATCDHSDELFHLVRNVVERFNQPFIIGGDWNTTLSNLPNEFNPDLYMHPSICNPIGTKFLNNWSEETGIVDPFRHIYPTKRDFSFVKTIRGTKSKARIDFFLVSNQLSELIGDACYEITPTSFFDHRMSTFCFKSLTKPHKKPVITSDAIHSPEMWRQTKLCVLNNIQLYANVALSPSLTESIRKLNDINFQIISINKHLETNVDLLLSNICSLKADEFENIQADINVNDLINSLTFSISSTNLLLMILNDIKLIGYNLSASIKKPEKATLIFHERG